MAALSIIFHQKAMFHKEVFDFLDENSENVELGIYWTTKQPGQSVAVTHSFANCPALTQFFVPCLHSTEQCTM